MQRNVHGGRFGAPCAIWRIEVNETLEMAEQTEVWTDFSFAAANLVSELLLRRKLYLCKVLLYSLAMIESFAHKGLQELFEKGKSAKVQASLVDRIVRRLDAIDIAKTPEALNLPGFDFHPLQGKPKRYSVHVNGPWCITFEWNGENALKINLENYH